jgi:hypothetical protein
MYPLSGTLNGTNRFPGNFSYSGTPARLASRQRRDFNLLAWQRCAATSNCARPPAFEFSPPAAGRYGNNTIVSQKE